jgi:hypothetical protein
MLKMFGIQTNNAIHHKKENTSFSCRIIRDTIQFAELEKDIISTG